MKCITIIAAVFTLLFSTMADAKPRHRGHHASSVHHTHVHHAHADGRVRLHRHRSTVHSVRGLRRSGVTVTSLDVFVSTDQMLLDSTAGNYTVPYTGPRSVVASPRASAREVRHETGGHDNYNSRWSDGIGPKPGRWCGWYMQHRTGVTSASTGLNLNKAYDWRRVGSPGDGSAGNILVGGNGASHVSQIISSLGGGCYITISGNAGRANGGVNEMRECGGTVRRL